MCTKIKIIWCRLPEIWSETAIIFWHFGPFFLFYANDWPPKLKFGKNVKKVSGDIILLHMCTINEDHMMYSSWDIRHDGQSFWHFGPFDPPSNPKNLNFEKLKNIPGDIITLHLCTTDGNYMMYGFWDIEHDRHSFCHFGLFLALLTPTPKQPKKSKFWTNEKKKRGDIIILHKCIINDNHMMYGVPEKWSVTDIICCDFELFFAILPR